MTAPIKKDSETFKTAFEVWSSSIQEEFFLYGLTPVMFLPRSDGGLVVKAFYRNSSDFVIDNSLWAEIQFDKSNLVKELTRPEFIEAALAHGATKEVIEAAMKT